MNKLILKDYFDKVNIIALAETHHGEHFDVINDFLDKFMPHLNGIFVELPVDYQSSINNYIETGKVDETLEDFFMGAHKEGNEIRGWLEIFDKIKRNKKMVICIDSSKIQTNEYRKKSDEGYYFLRGDSREEDMFFNLKNYYMKHIGKYLLIAGASHIRKEGHLYAGGKNNLGNRLSQFFGDKYDSVILNS